MIDVCLCGIAREDCDYHKPQLPAYSIPVHDVSGTKFVPGVTNFTAENLFDAMLIMDPREDFDITVHKHVHDRLDCHNLLNTDGTFQGMKVHIAPPGHDTRRSTGSVFDTSIQHIDGRRIILRTREY